jgi:hypothetical protein
MSYGEYADQIVQASKGHKSLLSAKQGTMTQLDNAF